MDFGRRKESMTTVWLWVSVAFGGISLIDISLPGDVENTGVDVSLVDVDVEVRSGAASHLSPQNHRDLQRIAQAQQEVQEWLRER